MEDDIDDKLLALSGHEDQREIMIGWFRERYEDPAQRTPYEEGEYIWIWGGPYDAETQLRDRFEDIVPEDVILALASELSDECPQWAPTSQPGDYGEYDEDLYEAVRSNTAGYGTLTNALDTIHALSSTSVSAMLEQPFRRLLFANAITVLEAFLSDIFINRVTGDPELLQRYIDKDPAFDRKIAYGDILREAEKLQDTVRSELLSIVWHDVGKAKMRYATVLRIDLGDMAPIGRAVAKRHDIVHRNGRCKDGTMLIVTTDDLDNLLDTIRAFAKRVTDSL